MFDIQIQFKKNPPLCKAERLDGCAQRRKKECQMSVPGKLASASWAIQPE
jgi:hypothetical protein